MLSNKQYLKNRENKRDSRRGIYTAEKMSKYVPIKDSPGDGDLKTEKTESTEATSENEVNDDEICELEHLRKLFIGGLAAYTSEESLKAFYEQWGKVVDVVVMRDTTTKRSRGFGFITYTKSSMVDKAQENRPHVIDGKTVEAKRALPRPERESRETNISVKKLFVGGLKDNHDEECLKEYFSQFGNVISIKILTDKTTGKRRGFAFIEFDDYDAVDKAILQKSHSIKYVVVDVKKSIYNQEQQNQSANQRALAAPGTNGAQQNKPPPPNKAGPMPPMPNGGYRPPVPPPGHMPPPPYQQPPMSGPPPNYNYWGHPPPPPPPGQHQYGYPPAPMNNWSYPPAPNGWQQPPGPPGPPPGNWGPHSWSGPPPVGPPPPANWGPPPQQMPPAGPPPPGVTMQQPPVPQQQPPPPASAAPVVPGQTPNFGTGYQQNYGGGPAKHSMNQNRMNPYQAGPSNGYANNGQPPNYGGYNGGGVVPPPSNGSVGKPPAAGAQPPNTPAPVPPVGSKYRR